jgi:hypothetical protein
MNDQITINDTRVSFTNTCDVNIWEIVTINVTYDICRGYMIFGDAGDKYYEYITKDESEFYDSIKKIIDAKKKYWEGVCDSNK